MIWYIANAKQEIKQHYDERVRECDFSGIIPYVYTANIGGFNVQPNSLSVYVFSLKKVQQYVQLSIADSVWRLILIKLCH